MNPLELRRRFLIAESELNRTQAIEDCAELMAGAGGLAKRAKSIGMIVSSVGLLFSAVAAIRRGRTSKAAGPVSWLQTAIKGAGLVSTIWLAFRQRRGDQKEVSSPPASRG